MPAFRNGQSTWRCHGRPGWRTGGRDTAITAGWMHIGRLVGRITHPCGHWGFLKFDRADGGEVRGDSPVILGGLPTAELEGRVIRISPAADHAPQLRRILAPFWHRHEQMNPPMRSVPGSRAQNAYIG
jgi:hypothetical protein